MIGKTNSDIRKTESASGDLLVISSIDRVYHPSDYGYDYFDDVTVAVETNDPCILWCGRQYFDVNAEIFGDITWIPTYFLYHCAYVRSVDLPPTVEVVGNYAFSYGGMTTVRVSSTALRELNNNAFAYSSSVTSLYFDAPNVTTLGNSLFAGMSNLRTANLVSIPRLPYNSLFDCYRLETLEIPVNCVYMDENSLGCSITFADSSAYIHVFFSRQHVHVSDGTVFQQVTQVYNNAFSRRPAYRTFIYSPVASICAYRKQFDSISTNRYLLPRIFAYGDYAAGALPSRAVNRCGNTQGTYVLTWYYDRDFTNPIPNNTVSEAGRYYATYTIEEEIELEE